MKIIVVHPFGNANVRAALQGFLNANLVYKFYTSIASFPNSILAKISKYGPFRELKRRTFDLALRPYTNMVPLREVGRQMALKGNLRFFTRHERGFFSVDGVYQHLDRFVSKSIKTENISGAKAVYGYEDGALHSFEAAKTKDMKCFYDLPIGYWRAAYEILEEERKKNPEWGITLLNFNDSEKKLERKDKELQLADKIFVASTFTAETLNAYPNDLAPISIIPYGFPPAIKSRGRKLRSTSLKLLFVGGLSQRKGLSYLFEAVANLGNKVTLTIVGNKVVPQCGVLDMALSKHHWIPSLPHEEVLKLMKDHDILVFPSLFEGFGLVITEAMSQGTPVITTNHTAGPDLIKNGENGWIVDAGSSKALEDCLKNLYENMDEIDRVGEAALRTAKMRPWSMYGQELAQAIVEK